MVYQFLTDLFVFNTHFSSLQYWGIAISAFTFVVDIYMTVMDDAKPDGEIADRKENLEQVAIEKEPIGDSNVEMERFDDAVVKYNKNGLRQRGYGDRYQ